MAAADDYSTYRLVEIRDVWSRQVPADASARIDKITHDASGGSIEFTQRRTETTGDCAGKTQHFKFSWRFSRDVSTFTGKQGDNLFTMTTTWEGDPGDKCLDESPFVWIHGLGAIEYPVFVNPVPENRVSFDGKGASNPTFFMSSPSYPSAGIDIIPAIRNLGTDVQLTIAYVYEKVPGTPTATGTTAPQTTVAATTTTVMPTTTAAVTVVSPATTTLTTRVTTAPTGTGGSGGTGGTGGVGAGGCSWTGTWETTWGQMTLSEASGWVTGTYARDGGVIEGSVSGNSLTGRWSEAPSYKEPNDAGQFVFTMAPDCKSFTGTWGYGGEKTGNSWTGTRGGASGTAATTATTTVATTTSSSGSGGTGSGGGTGGTTVRNTCPASGMLVYIDPWTPSPGQTVEIPVWCCNAQDLANMDLTVLYNPAVLTFVSARKGGLLGSDFLFESNDLGGQVKISFAGTKGVYGSGAIAILTFRVAGATGTSTGITPRVNTASNGNGTPLNVPAEGGTVTVKPPDPNNPEGRPCGPTALTALKALQMAVNKIPMDMAYDVTRDGTVNSADARELLRLAADQVCVL